MGTRTKTSKYILDCHFQTGIHLVQVTVDALVKDELNEELFDFSDRDIQLLYCINFDMTATRVKTNLSHKSKLNPCVWLNEFDQDLGPNVFQDLVNVPFDKGIAHNGVLVRAKNAFKFPNVLVLEGLNKIGHGSNLSICFVSVHWLSLTLYNWKDNKTYGLVS